MNKLCLAVLLAYTSCLGEPPSRAEFFSESTGMELHSRDAQELCYDVTYLSAKNKLDANPYSVFWTCLHIFRAAI